jgi:cellobiose phosphorylase
MKYGKFSPDGKEFIITDPNTPRPWGNFLTNEKYCAVISQTAGGYSFYKDSKTERMLYWTGQNLHQGRPGRYVFIQDAETKKAFSASWEPIRAKYDDYECRVGFGYQMIRTKANGIEAQTTYFVPTDEPCEIWKVKIKNTTKKTKKLNVFGYLEWFIGSADYITFYNISILWNRVSFDKDSSSIFARKTAFYEEFNIKNNPYVLFFSSSEKIAGWDCHKENFLGRGNTCQDPEGVYKGKCTQSICDGEEPIAVLQNKITLKPGETKELQFILGQTAGQKDAERIIKKFKGKNAASKALEYTIAHWAEALAPIKVETPDKDFDVLVNNWVKYQLYMCNMWSRSPSFYHEGQGGRGLRDSCQDSESILSVNPDLAKAKMLKVASLTRRDGTMASGWSDTYGPYSNRPFKDHPTWLTPSVAAYVRETGDKDILFEEIPWLKDRWREGGTKTDINWHGGSVEDGKGTLFDHLLAQLNFTYNDVSVHGLPRVGEADWNDALDMAGRKQIGESVWLAIALVRALKNLAELAGIIGKSDIREDLLQKASSMSEKINESGWDGRWYLAGYNDDLVPFGSYKNKEGKIFLNSQSWAVLADLVPEDRMKVMLESVEKHLTGPHGMALLAPAYTVFDPGLGRIAMFSRGTKENAAVFCHAQTFMIAAYAKLGMGDTAYREMCKIMPNKQKDAELYKAEPYTYAEYLIGPDHPYAYGEGAYTWLTGTAGWTFMVATEWVMGARREFDGLRVDPCIPSKWKKCKITRPFRGAVYEIEIENPKGIEHGVESVEVDGQKIKGNLIAPHSDGRIHKVRVLMG